jgi:hypothetical protein
MRHASRLHDRPGASAPVNESILAGDPAPGALMSARPTAATRFSGALHAALLLPVARAATASAVAAERVQPR